jgi:hypothetical protein
LGFVFTFDDSSGFGNFNCLIRFQGDVYEMAQGYGSRVRVDKAINKVKTIGFDLVVVDFRKRLSVNWTRQPLKHGIQLGLARDGAFDFVFYSHGA